MLKKDFLDFYQNIIKVRCLMFVSENSEYGFVDEPLQIYQEYLNQKTLMRVVMDKPDNHHLLDRHKVCAAMTVAILKCRPVVKRTIDDDKGTFKLADASKINEQIAFYSCLSLLISFIEKSPANKKFQLPPTTHNVDFADTFSRSLFLANVQNSLCPELIANVYFLLESYDRDCK